jgi:molybdate transport system substrate-binding protein
MDMRQTILAEGVIAVWCLLTQAAGADEVRVFTPRAGATVLQELQSDFQKQTGDTLVITLDSGPNLVAKVEKGEPFDLLIAGAPIINAEIAKSLLVADTRKDLFRSSLGIIARAGAPKPDVSSVEKLKETLLAAQSIAFLKGVNGVEGILKRLGLDGQLQTKLRPQTRDIVSELVASGDVDLAITAVTQAFTTSGVELVGRLPAEAQFTIQFVAAVGMKSTAADRAGALIGYLLSPKAMQVITSQGLDVN